MSTQTRNMHIWTYRIDIDGTIARPKFFHDDFQECMAQYIQAGIVRPEEINSFTYHQQAFLLPHVLITHQAIEGAVTVLQRLAHTGRTLQYFTVRQNFDPKICQKVHAQTKAWLEAQGFPHPQETQFFWDPAKKLTQALEAREEYILLIDDRPQSILNAFVGLTEKDAKTANRIRERVTLVAFQCTVPEDTKGLRVIPLTHWSHFDNLCTELEHTQGA
jgi:hypothetical protein